MYVRVSVALIALSLSPGCSNHKLDGLPATVGIVLPKQFFVSEVSAPFDIYKHAGEDMEVLLLSDTMAPVEGYYGEILHPDATYDDAPDLDVLVVPSGGRSMDEDLEDDDLVGFVRKAARKAAYVTSHCWGAFVLGAAGVLDGRSATTFPGYTDPLRKAFPSIDRVVEDERWVHEDFVITSNGGMAAYEASLHVVEEILGPEAAEAVAGGLVFDEENLDYSRSPDIDSVPTTTATLPTSERTYNVAVLIMDGLFINEAVAPFDIYAHAGDAMNVYFVAASMDPITGYYGERISPHYSYADAPPADILVVPSGGGSMDEMLTDQATIDWVKTQADGAEWVTSHCWGAFTLASAGLLDGKTVTTFPGYFDELRTAFPGLGQVVEDRRVVRDGKFVTSNGGLAAYEASLYVVEQILGATAGDVIAQGLVFAHANLANARDPIVVE